MDRLLQDLRYAIRGLRRAPAYTLVAVMTLALGIGVNSAVFSVVNAILYRPLPVAQPERLIDIYGRPSTAVDHQTNSWPNYLSYRESNRTLVDVIGYSNFFAHFSLDNSAELVVGELVTDRYFDVVGVPMQLGRSFTSDELAVPGAGAVAVLSHRMWQQRFGGASNVVGQTFRMNGRAYTVVGVAPESFGGMMPAVTAQMWIPATMADLVEPVGNQRISGTAAAQGTGTSRFDRRQQHWMWLKARLRDGVTVQQARADLEAIAARLETEFPATNAEERVIVLPSTDVRINPDADRVLSPVGIVLLSAVGLVLVVACANLANLQLARAAGRRREFALRQAVGANRARLVRQLLTESVLLALVGGAIAIPFAHGFAAVVERVRPPLPLDLGFSLSPDWRVLAYTLVIALLTGIVFGLMPAIRASRPDLVAAINGASGADGRRRRVELRDTLVVVQMALSLVLVVSGALLVRSLSVASRVDLGYDADRIAQVALALEMNGYNAERGGQFLADAQRRLAEMPGVEAVATASRLPMSLNNNGFRLYIDGRQTSSADAPFIVDGASVDEHYFAALDVPLIAGRNIDPADRDEERRVAVVTRAFAQRFWPGAPEGAVGREFRTRFGGTPYTVIGVVENYKVNTPGESGASYLHLPLGRRETFGNILVRMTGPAAPRVLEVERTLRTMDPSLVFLDKGTLRSLADVRLFPLRAGAWLIGAMGLLALTVAAVGLYGVIGYSVTRRTREIAIRKAVGAQPAQLVTMVLREGMSLVLVGGVIGAALSVAAARVLSSVLFVGAFDVISFAVAFGVLALVALTANAMPARRAARVDPMVALRESA